MEKAKNKFGTLILEKSTVSFGKYTTENGLCELLMLFMHVASQYISSEDKLPIIQRFVNELKTSNSKIDNSVKNILELYGDNLFEVETYEPYFCFLAYTRSMDNFVSYLKDILIEVMNKKPELLKSNELESVEFILSFNNMEDLKKTLIDRKIEKLLYKGIDELLKYFKDRLGLDLVHDTGDKMVLNQMIKQRNLIVHNRGIISNTFAKEFPQYEKNIGDTIQFNYKQISKINILLNNVLVEFDEIISKKFKLDLINLHV